MQIVVFVCACGLSLFPAGSISHSLERAEVAWGEPLIYLVEQEGQQTPRGKKPSTEKDLPTLPPPENDPEMVIKPDVPPNPDAVVIPPPIDPEMAVDPATREPMTKEKLEDLQQSETPDDERPGEETPSSP